MSEHSQALEGQLALEGINKYEVLDDSKSQITKQELLELFAFKKADELVYTDMQKAYNLISRKTQEELKGIINGAHPEHKKRLEAFKRALPDLFEDEPQIMEIVFLWYLQWITLDSVKQDRETMEGIKKQPLNLIKYPDQYTASTDNFINDLAGINLSDISYEISRNSGKYITGTILLDDPHIRELLPSLTNEQLLYMEGAANIWLNFQAGLMPNVFTPDVLYRFATGRKDAELKDKKRANFIAMIEDMARMRSDIDITEYLITGGVSGSNEKIKAEIKAGKRIRLKTYIMPIKQVTGENMQGKEQETIYTLLDAPLSLQLNKLLAKERRAFIDAYLLEPLTTSIEDSLIRKYIVSRLALLENPNNKMTNNKILFDTLYKYIDIKNPDGNKRRDIKNKVTILLDDWKKIGRIKSYEFTHPAGDVRRYDGFKITYISRPSPKNKAKLSGKK